MNLYLSFDFVFPSISRIIWRLIYSSLAYFMPSPKFNNFTWFVELFYFVNSFLNIQEKEKIISTRF